MSARFLPLLPACLLLAACDTDPVSWEATTLLEATPLAPQPASEEVLRALPPSALPTDARGRRCDASVRVATLNGGHVVAVWWAVRADSTAVLLSARGEITRPAGDPTANAVATATWEPAVPIDTVDRGAHGCTRPAPAVAFEPRTAYVHVSYPLDAPEGTGVFFAHSMDAGRMYHSPVSIVYGPRLASTAIAAVGDTVAIAYEDPNTAEPQVALALSVTAGHIFEEKSIPVSAGAWAAVAPTVAVDARGVTVAWRERRPDREVPMQRRGAWAR